ncbi:DnaD domain-containing protein [Paenibacillus sp. Marseille-P2973]|uniref:DnaD domain-containing protein n=1 Tax=Paenibacillus sp. Marseille-P2973 TaxID=1871032 RepID=UPI001B398FE9|nr:DnaD domain-containing protein [Paenibacillus sp. Marseille-P2973]MBQ4898421.1 DnaD domain-containing protein [Paenibacillus sp. Marseille-P2973]
MTDSWKVWGKGISFGLESGIVNVPFALLAHYRNLRLTDMEAMLLLQLLAFQQVERNDFPTMDQLERRMGTSPGELAPVIRRLMKEGWLSIDEAREESSGVHSEFYNLSGMYVKLGQHLAEERSAAINEQKLEKELSGSQRGEQERNLFVIFEKEFARPLSPMECETISGWVDQDGYLEELILLALKEAVFAGKVHFRYIDRILLEWSRNRVKTAEDARAYTQKFRNGGR